MGYNALSVLPSLANIPVSRLPTLRTVTSLKWPSGGDIINPLIEQLTALKLHGMVQAASILLASKKPPIWHKALLQLAEAERVEREVRSIAYQTRMARFPHHKDLATFDYTVSAVKKKHLNSADNRAIYRAGP